MAHRPIEITCPKGHGTYEADRRNEPCPVCEDGYGTGVGPEDKVVECPGCGTLVAPGKECSECGQDISQLEPDLTGSP